MPLAPVDFSNVKELENVPVGTKLPGMTKSWEAKPASKDPTVSVVHAKFTYEWEGLQRTITTYWTIKPENLWSCKRDLIAMGADPSDLEGTDVDLEAILNEFFATPTPVWLTFGLGDPYETNEVDEYGNRKKVQRNTLTKIEAYD